MFNYSSLEIITPAPLSPLNVASMGQVVRMRWTAATE